MKACIKAKVAVKALGNSQRAISTKPVSARIEALKWWNLWRVLLVPTVWISYAC